MAWLVALAAAVGCDNNPEHVESAPHLDWGPAADSNYVPPATGLPVYGDWFACEDDDCTEIDGNGVRFASGGILIELQSADRRLEADEPYCEDDTAGSFFVDFRTVHIWNRGGDSFSMTLDADGGWLRTLGGGRGF